MQKHKNGKKVQLLILYDFRYWIIFSTLQKPGRKFQKLPVGSGRNQPDCPASRDGEEDQRQQRWTDNVPRPLEVLSDKQSFLCHRSSINDCFLFSSRPMTKHRSSPTILQKKKYISRFGASFFYVLPILMDLKGRDKLTSSSTK